MSLLEHIQSPADLRQLDLDQLPQLADEIRARIISTVAENGGHLASNLGAVELTLALHYAFDTPNDAIVWDVGHQCYTHKLLTGRQQQFDTLRKFGGMSGFCNRDESEYDSFTTGHSSNSISLALGLATADELNGRQRQIVAVIGDGSLTGGESFEALDHAGDRKRPLIVVLNDNGMSINRNVGALSSHLTRLRANPKYHRAKQRTRNALEKVPLIGAPLASGVSWVKRVLKSAFIQGMLFENLGFVYLGPIDGHDIPAMVDLLRRAQKSNKPVLIHIHTTKGKGYAPAEQFPQRWHGTDAFYIQSGLPKNGKPRSYTSVFGEAICQLGQRDPRVVAITAAMADGTGLVKFGQQFPGRLYDVGIAEQHAVSFGAGLAAGGLRPIIAIYSTFFQRAYDQLLSDVCLQRLPVVLAVDRAGLVGEDGASHQGIFDISYLRTLPGMTILAPADGEELRLMLDYAVTLGAPCAIRYPRAAAAWLEHPHPPLEQGRSAILREGNDLAIFALGAQVTTALEAADLLADQGIRARVIDARFAAPLDEGALRQAARECQGRIVTMEENVGPGGFGEACRAIAEPENATLLALALPLTFPAHGKRDELLKSFGLDAPSVAKTVLESWFSHEK